MNYKYSNYIKSRKEDKISHPETSLIKIQTTPATAKSYWYGPDWSMENISLTLAIIYSDLYGTLRLITIHYGVSYVN